MFTWKKSANFLESDLEVSFNCFGHYTRTHLDWSEILHYSFSRRRCWYDQMHYTFADLIHIKQGSINLHVYLIFFYTSLWANPGHILAFHCKCTAGCQSYFSCRLPKWCYLVIPHIAIESGWSFLSRLNVYLEVSMLALWQRTCQLRA